MEIGNFGIWKNLLELSETSFDRGRIRDSALGVPCAAIFDGFSDPVNLLAAVESFGDFGVNLSFDIDFAVNFGGDGLAATWHFV